MAGFYPPYKVFTVGEVLTAADLNASEQQHITYQTAVASQGYSTSLAESRVQISSATLSTTVADEFARLREKIRLLGAKTYWDEVQGPAGGGFAMQPKAQIFLPMEGAQPASNTDAANKPPQPHRRMVPKEWAVIGYNPNPIELVYLFDAALQEWLCWKFVVPVGYTSGQPIELVCKFSMATGAMGNVRIVAGLAPTIDEASNVATPLTTPVTGPDNIPTPSVFGMSKEIRIPLPVNNVVAGAKCMVVVGFWPASTNNAAGDRILEACWLEFTRGNVPLPASAITNPMDSLGDMIIGGTSGEFVKLDAGPLGHVLTMSGGSPAWLPPSTMSNPMAAFGDMIVGGGGGSPTRLPISIPGKSLVVGPSGAPEWGAPGGFQPGAVIYADASGGLTGSTGKLSFNTNGDSYLGVKSSTTQTYLGTDGVDSYIWGENLVGNIWMHPGTHRTFGFVPDGHVKLTTDPTVDTSYVDLYAKPDGLLYSKFGANPEISLGGGGSTNPMTTKGDMIRALDGGVSNRLPIGPAWSMLQVLDNGLPNWTTEPTGIVYRFNETVSSAVGGAPGWLALYAKQGTDKLYYKNGAGQEFAIGNPMTAVGDLIYGQAAGDPTRLPIGTNGYVLTSDSGLPMWRPSPGIINPMQAPGDLIIGGVAGAPGRLPIGTSGQQLVISGSTITWTTIPAGMPNPMTNVGDVIVGSTSGAPAKLSIGGAGQILTVVGGVPVWQTPAAGMTNPMNAVGDIIYGGASGVPTKRGIGTANQVLAVSGGLPTWVTLPAPGMANPMTTIGDLILAGASGAPGRLGTGTIGNVLTVGGAGVAEWAAAPVTGMTNPMTASGDIIYGAGAGAPTRLGKGSDTQVLTLVAGIPAWQTPISGGMTNPMTTSGDIIVGGSAGAAQRLAKGTDTQVLTLSGGMPVWQAPVSGGMTNPMSAVGDVIIGGASGTANRLAIGTTGHVLTVTAGSPAWAAAVGFANPMTGVGDLIRGGTSGAPTRLAPGTNSHVLTLTAGVPGWAAAPGFASPMTTLGDIITGGASGVPGRLGIGSNSQVLTVVAGVPGWAAGMTNPMTTTGDLIRGGAAGAPTRLAVGTDGHVLTLAAGVPGWAAPTTGMTNPMTTPGDLIRGGTSGAPTRLAIGTNGQFLTVSAGALAWGAGGLTNPMTTTGDTIIGGASGVPARLGVGSNSQVLTVSGGNPTWAAATGFANPMTSVGDLILGGASGAATRLAAPATGQLLISQGAGTAPIWSQDPAIRNLKMQGGTVGTSGVGVLAIGPSTEPTTSPVDSVQLYTVDMDGQAGARSLRARDERGGVVTFGSVTGGLVLRLTEPTAVTTLNINVSPSATSFGTSTDTTLSLLTNNIGRLILDTSYNVQLAGSSIGAGGAGVLALGPGTAPTTSPVDTVQLWTADCLGEAGSRGLTIRDERGGLYTAASASYGTIFEVTAPGGGTSIYLYSEMPPLTGGGGLGTRTMDTLNFWTGDITHMILGTDGRLDLNKGAGLWIGPNDEIASYLTGDNTAQIHMKPSGGHDYYFINGGTGSAWVVGEWRLYDATANRTRLRWDSGGNCHLGIQGVDMRILAATGPDSAGAGWRYLIIAN